MTAQAAKSLLDLMTLNVTDENDLTHTQRLSAVQTTFDALHKDAGL